MEIKYIVFDWGDTLMRDLSFPGPMKDWPEVFLIPDIEISLKELQNNFKLYVGSNAGDSVSADIEKALQRTGILKYFDKVFSSKDIGYEKPHIKFFENIRSELKADPEEVLMIGNSCKKDIEGAKQDGWNTIWFNESQEPGENCEHADAIIYHMSQLTELVHILNQRDDI